MPRKGPYAGAQTSEAGVLLVALVFGAAASLTRLQTLAQASPEPVVNALTEISVNLGGFSTTRRAKTFS